MLNSFWIACDNFANRSGRAILNLWERFTHKANQTQKKMKPIVDSTYQAGLALYTFYTTAQISISILPLVISSIAIFRYIPFFNSLTMPYVYALGFSLSAVAGYFKYQDLKHRKYLDEQVETNKEEIDMLRRELALVQSKVEVLSYANPRRTHSSRVHHREPIQFRKPTHIESEIAVNDFRQRRASYRHRH